MSKVAFFYTCQFVLLSVFVPTFREKAFFLLLGKSVVIQSFVGVTFMSFVGPIDFVSQQMKPVGVGGNYTVAISINQ